MKRSRSSATERPSRVMAEIHEDDLDDDPAYERDGPEATGA